MKNLSLMLLAVVAASAVAHPPVAKQPNPYNPLGDISRDLRAPSIHIYFRIVDNLLERGQQTACSTRNDKVLMKTVRFTDTVRVAWVPSLSELNEVIGDPSPSELLENHPYPHARELRLVKRDEAYVFQTQKTVCEQEEVRQCFSWRDLTGVDKITPCTAEERQKS